MERIMPPNIKLIPVPLPPFTSPTGPYDHTCDCTYGCCSWEEPDPDCSRCNGTGRDKGEYVPCQRKSSEDDRIKEGTLYLGKCGENFWEAGRCYKAHYGWSFNGHQLDMVEFLYEMVVENE